MIQRGGITVVKRGRIHTPVHTWKNTYSSILSCCRTHIYLTEEPWELGWIGRIHKHSIVLLKYYDAFDTYSLLIVSYLVLLTVDRLHSGRKRDCAMTRRAQFINKQKMNPSMPAYLYYSTSRLRQIVSLHGLQYSSIAPYVQHFFRSVMQCDEYILYSCGVRLDKESIEYSSSTTTVCEYHIPWYIILIILTHT